MLQNKKVVELTDEEMKGYTVDEIDTTDIYSKDELIRYINYKRVEDNIIKQVEDKLKQIDVTYWRRTEGRFEHYDMDGVSGDTVPVCIEFKYRPDITSSQYKSVVIDEAKYQSLLQLTYIDEVIVVYIYGKDKKIRVLHLNKYKDKYDYKFTRRIKDNVYNNRMREKTFYSFDNSKTILIN